MKKILLICFLGGLCLFGSETQAKVASPGAHSLHRLYGPNRGGDSLSDSFLHQREVIQTSVIGHPTPLSSPVSGLSSLTIGHRSSNTGHPTLGFSLVGNPGPRGQEESIPSARMDATHFYMELPATLASDTLWLTYWEHFLDDNKEATPGTTIPLIAFQGDFFRGNRGYKSYHWSPNQASGPLFFKIRDNRNWLLNTWTILPEDQVRVRKELTNGQTYFLGPSAEFFQAQHLLSSLAETQKLEAHPLMVTNNTEHIFSDSATHARYQLAIAQPENLFPPMLFFSPASEDNSLTDSLLSLPLSENSLIKALPGLISTLIPEKQSLISQRAWGEVLSAKLSRLNLNRKILNQPEYRQKYEAWKSGIPDLSPGENLDPLFLKAVYELAILDAFVYEKTLLEVLETYPTSMRDPILGRYLVNTFRRREGAQASSLQTGLDRIQTPWIRKKLLDLQSTALPGSPFNPAALTDVSGQPFDLEQFKGKSMVISFWISGCKFCIKYYENTLKPVFEQFADHDDLVFITVNADTDQKFWKEHLATGRYADSTMINLHQDSGTGILDQYQISSFPQKLLIGQDFNLFLLTKTQYSPEELSKMIDSMAGENRSYSQSKPK